MPRILSDDLHERIVDLLAELAKLSSAESPGLACLDSLRPADCAACSGEFNPALAVSDCQIEGCLNR